MSIGQLRELLAFGTIALALLFLMAAMMSEPAKVWQIFVATVMLQAALVLVPFNMVWDDRYSGTGHQRLASFWFYAIAMAPATVSLWLALFYTTKQALTDEVMKRYRRKLLRTGLVYLPGLALIAITTAGSLG
ncbi:hypothetical protein [Noviherbaspirillum sp.]|uniref:hypothetical protein n=1 Tax=Noviherbaspirillum sp. TaxID=1926288 RepID=UPI002FE3D3BC